MAEGRRSDAWERTSFVLAMLINVNRTKGRPVSPAECNPLLAARVGPAKKTPIRSLRALFVEGMGFEVRRQAPASGESA